MNECENGKANVNVNVGVEMGRWKVELDGTSMSRHDLVGSCKFLYIELWSESIIRMRIRIRIRIPCPPDGRWDPGSIPISSIEPKC
jgi:hypothetical protein